MLPVGTCAVGHWRKMHSAVGLPGDIDHPYRLLPMGASSPDLIPICPNTNNVQQYSDGSYGSSTVWDDANGVDI